MDKTILIILGYCLGSISIASAGALEQGIRFFEQKDYAQAKELWQPLAKEGDARAQYNLALLLFKETQSDLQQQKASQYLAMSQSTGLIDGYFVTMSVLMSQNQNSDIEKPIVWLNQQEKSHYTLQLATGKSQKSLEKMKLKYLSSQQLEQPEHLFIHKVEKNKQDKIITSYVLVYGIFESYQNAKDEVKKLPDSIQKSSPWIRQFGVLQSIVIGERKNKRG